MTLLDAHRDVVCAGEQYNPYGVIDTVKTDNSHEAVMGRDKDPVGHMRHFFRETAAQGVVCGGFKFMIGHNLRVLQQLAADPEITIIYIWRENRLAQAASLIKAEESLKWAQTRPDKHISRKVSASPRQISQRWHEFATTDHLIGLWLAGLPNHKITYEYCDLFKPGFNEGVCAFLGVTYQPEMKSPLVKQSNNSIVERFEHPNPIRYYFNQLGLARWLGDEL